MPTAIRSHKPRAGAPVKYRTLREKQAANGRTLALDGAAWRKLRALVLREEPLCRCGCGQPATDVDHIDSDPTNNARGNLQGLAHSCHSRKTRREMTGNHQQPGAANRTVSLARATAKQSA